MRFHEAHEAFADAKNTMRAVDQIAGSMAEMLVGRLHQCDHSSLEKLKRELRNFNSRTGKWRSK